ncbi:hypothetical protein ACFQ0B_14655 [Nonomuraea thailandensis]
MLASPSGPLIHPPWSTGGAVSGGSNGVTVSWGTAFIAACSSRDSSCLMTRPSWTASPV